MNGENSRKAASEHVCKIIQNQDIYSEINKLQRKTEKLKTKLSKLCAGQM